jgi:hypothetical protein
VLELLVGEAHERFERGLIGEPVVAAHLEHLRGDEPLDQPKHVRVRATLDLAERPAIEADRNGSRSTCDSPSGMTSC